MGKKQDRNIHREKKYHDREMERLANEAVVFANEMADVLQNPETSWESSDQQDSQESPPNLKSRSSTPGSGIRIDRDASQSETCLNVHQYAAAFANLLQGIQSDCCVALLGHWGRGKTHLIELVAGILPDKVPLITFSAWKYQQTPETWVFLYETIARRARELAFFHRLAVSMRVGIEKHGRWSFASSLIGLLVLLLPPAFFFDTAYVLAVTFGISAVVILFRLLKSSYQTYQNLRSSFLELPSYSDKLGLQSVVGSDIQNLILALTTPKRKLCDGIRYQWPLLAAGFVISLAAIIFTIKPGTFWGQSASANTQVVLALAVWWPTVFFAIGLAEIGGPKWKRCLVAVDDLDRCTPSKSLHIAESIKLLLEEPDLRSRLGVIMLVDEDVFYPAIREKYQNTMGNECKEQSALQDSRVYEHMEKLFLCHLRLPQVAPHALGQVAVNAVLAASIEYCESSLDSIESISTDSQIANQNKSGTLIGHSPFRLKATAKEVAAFSEEEMAGIKEAVIKIASRDFSRRWGPRSVRCWMAKYQLARELAAQLNSSISSEELMQSLNDKLLKGDATSREVSSQKSEWLNEIVSAVS